MLISLNWLRDFVDMPASLDPRELAERFTLTTAEVEGVEHATRLPDGVRFPPGSALPDSEREDWIIEVDNKSITHRPDLWGHYGIAREVAAMLGTPLRPYPVTPIEQLGDPAGPEIAIVIDDPARCPRYTGLVIRGLKDRAAPATMQVRLARCGMRPLGLLVDLTNYVMLELGQPMHAFDAAGLDRIEVATAAPGERFRTLDGVERVMPPGTLMIQSHRRSVAIAGIMGGAESEVSSTTAAILLESANFDAATIRRAAAAMGMRTEASARFEKSLDPTYTVLGIARFVRLAREQMSELSFGSRLSDCYPRPLEPAAIDVDPAFAARFIGRDVAADEMARILRSLEFRVESSGPRMLVRPPTFRATKDISIEADVIEEVARSIGYAQIAPTLPAVTTRFVPVSPLLRLERATLAHLASTGFCEIHGYIWYDDSWLARLGFEPGECVRLRNPAAADCSRLRRTLMPGLIAAAERNRHHFGWFRLMEVGSVFHPSPAPERRASNDDVTRYQQRHLGLAVGMAGAKEAETVWSQLKQAVETWARCVLGSAVTYDEAEPSAPWEDAARLAQARVAGVAAGRIALLSLGCRQRIDERLRGWSMALAELDLSALGGLLDRHEPLSRVPEFPRVRLDFSFLADARRRYSQIATDLAGFEHALLRRLSYVGSFEGGSVPTGKRSFTVRAELGLSERTLTEADVQGFQSEFTAYLVRLGLELRT